MLTTASEQVGLEGSWCIDGRRSSADLVLLHRGAEVTRERLPARLTGTLRVQGDDPARWSLVLVLEPPAADALATTGVQSVRFDSRVVHRSADGRYRFFGKLVAGRQVAMVTIAVRAGVAAPERDLVEIRAVAPLPADDVGLAWTTCLARAAHRPVDAAALHLDAYAVRAAPPGTASPAPHLAAEARPGCRGA